MVWLLYWYFVGVLVLFRIGFICIYFCFVYRSYCYDECYVDVDEYEYCYVDDVYDGYVDDDGDYVV